MADVFLNTKWHRNIEKLSVTELERLARFAQTEYEKYLDYTKRQKPGNYDRDVRTLTERIALVSRVLNKKRSE